MRPPTAQNFFNFMQFLENLAKSYVCSPRVGPPFYAESYPGSAAAGVGNFLMLGLLDQHLQPRNYTWIQWIQTANILFLDYLGDSRFSVCDDSSLNPQTMEEITQDLVMST